MFWGFKFHIYKIYTKFDFANKRYKLIDVYRVSNDWYLKNEEIQTPTMALLYHDNLEEALENIK
jgi:hypothetical protein